MQKLIKNNWKIILQIRSIKTERREKQYYVKKSVNLNQSEVNFVTFAD